MFHRFTVGLLGIWVLVNCHDVQAEPYFFESASGTSRWIDVEYWTGAGEAETILVVDWNNSGDYASASHAFGYRWDGSPTTEAAMLAAICDAGSLQLTTGHGGEFIVNFFYTDFDGDQHQHTEEGSWSLGSTSDALAAWGPLNSNWTLRGQWDAILAGVGSEYIADGHLEGINAMWWFDTSKPTLDLTVPAPEPGSALLLAAGGLCLLGRRRRTACHSRADGLKKSGRSYAKYLSLAVLASLTFSLTPSTQAAGYVYNPDDFAVELVSSSGLPATSLYNDPEAVLGQPSTWFYNQWGSPGDHRVKLVEPAYNESPDGDRLITTLSLNSQITVKMGRKVYDDPANPYGIDLLVFGNSFFVGDGGTVDELTNMNTFGIDGSIFAEPMQVSVSPDNENWYRYENGPYGDDMFPTNAYVWDRENTEWTDELADPTKPVNPALMRDDFNGSAADAIDLYRSTINGQTFMSAGGTGFDLAESGFGFIQYVRVEGIAGFANGEIDAFADVSPIRDCPAMATYGDFNCDATVSLLDLDILGSNWQASGITYAQGDANGDGQVGLLDLDILGSNWATDLSTPEPASGGLLAVGLLIAVNYRTRSL